MSSTFDPHAPAAPLTDLADGAHAAVHDAVAGYSDEPKPLGGYAVLVGAFNLLFLAGSAAAVRRRGPDALERPRAGDLALLALATHKFSRLLTKDRVTSVLRAPFVRYKKDSSMHGEVEEEPRGEGLRLALGELAVCPYCVGQWVAGGFAVGWAFSPRRTRYVASVYGIMTVADFLHLAYLRATKDAASD